MIWKRLFFLLSAGILACALVTVTTSSTSPARAASAPVFTVMNTSESPPDGVYFRNTPDWNDTSRTYGLGVFMNEQVQLQCYTFGQAIGPYNDQLWYYVLNVSRPANYDGQANQGMLNAHYINDGQLANAYDGDVPACVNHRPPAPVASPTQSNAPPAPVASDPKPSGNIQMPPIPDMKARAQRAKQPSPSTATLLRDSGLAAEMQSLLNFCYQAYFSHCYNYGEHYLQASGTEQFVSMNELLGGLGGLPSLRDQYQFWVQDNVGRAAATLKLTPANSAVTRAFDTAGTTQNWTRFDAADRTTDWHYAIGNFSIRMRGNVWIGPVDKSGVRPLQIQYRLYMFDVYNFTPGDRFGSFEKLAEDGIAADFLITGASRTTTISTTSSALNPRFLVLQW